MAPPDQPGSRKSIADLIAVMAALRTPGSGCPWDLEQSFETIAPYTIEEAYEVADAIERGDRADLKEELGDLLLQVVYHARMAEEEGSFGFADVVDAITTKMIRRHPHVFGDEQARSVGVAKGWWEAIKAEERAAKQEKSSETPVPPSLLADVPVGLPGLTRAMKLQAKAARVGFDWPSLAPVFSKMREEIAELEEIGDVLFVMANVARHLKIDPETALRTANAKFVRRFAYIEQRLAEQGKTPAGTTLQEMDDLWVEAKTKERRG
jgi:MazG family protein